MNILASRCLLGEPCRYDGAGKVNQALALLQRGGHTLIPVCPEVLGGLTTPRTPAELQEDGRVVNQAGEDVTEEYCLGAQRVVALALEQECTLAVLKANSPSCGSSQIYDGTFSKTLIPGLGVTAQALMDAGVRVVDETQLERELPPKLFCGKNPSKQVKR